MTFQKKRRPFTRKSQNRPYRKTFVIECEGKITESQYFTMLGNKNDDIQIKCNNNNNNSDPDHVLKKIKLKLKNKKELRKDNEAWVVIDKDKWTDEQLQKLYKWSKKSEKYHVAITNPKFEFWLLLHFEDAKKLNYPSTYKKKLTDHLGRPYEKRIKENDITDEQIKLAIERATQRDDPPCESWPHNHGTTIYRLVEKLIEKK